MDEDVAKVSQGDSMAMEEKPCSMPEGDEEDLDIRHCRGIKQDIKHEDARENLHLFTQVSSRRSLLC